ncbi:D-hexose-6-phosphate mutarotase [Thiomicrorhabdus sp. 6S3-12]|uniref:D-hexose-6-phosphate mutarotase n=1 Tax=Thiomicrorhabdus sp. 6S3-12 TaxID=2819681 RepID=UPI001AADF465|nr:D-hexose-6-phosphate mutarotase [Thiomicrorhabdus sp. 6S3-12]MBO1923426.1 D-hexose-6-phosphate mutarotase [Thiomicrorhabdus sp. 6S3-12]
MPFSHIPGVTFSMHDALSLIEVENDYAKAIMTAHGATVLSYCPKDKNGDLEEDLLWVSEQAVYDGKAAIRGGIPVCWPWFSGYQSEFNAPLEEGAQPPAHGFVRKMSWHLENVEKLPSGVTSVLFSLSSSKETLAIWPYAFALQLQVVVGETLSLSLTTHNLNAFDLQLTEALHTYFRLPPDGTLQLDGLQGATQIETLQQNRQNLVGTPLVVQSPIDNVYLNAGPSLQASVKGEPVLQIDSSQARSCIVWNPGPETVKGFSDIENRHWTQFVCIENGNVWNNFVTVPAESKHKMQIAICKP